MAEDGASRPGVNVKVRRPLKSRIADNQKKTDERIAKKGTAAPSTDPAALSAVDPAPRDGEVLVHPNSAYRDEYAAQAVKLVRLGATNAELADFFGVTIDAVKYWAASREEFCAALKNGRDAFTDRIERSLAQRAVGYTFDSVKIFCNKDGDVVEVPFREHVPPDVTACIFWLKNRRPEDWHDVHRHEHTGSVTINVTEQETKW